MGLVNTLQYIWRHPLNQKSRWRALWRYASWQVGARLVPGPVVVPFVEEAKLLMHPGWVGATGNWYTGLHEFEDMAFLLHYLRPDEWFVDVGANIGSYTVLAGAVAKARVICAEPLSHTYSRLVENIRINHLEERVTALQVGVAERPGTLRFSDDQDACNHVLPGDATSGQGVSVPIMTLTEMVGEKMPTFIKIDVEGYETQVIEGGQSVLHADKLGGLVMEYGAGMRYGFDEEKLHQKLMAFGFTPCRYLPFDRKVEPTDKICPKGGNRLYLRDVQAAQARVQEARKIKICDVFL